MENVLSSMMDTIDNVSLETVQLENELLLNGRITETERDRRKRKAASVERSELREVCRG
jgi:hypothetical protein